MEKEKHRRSPATKLLAAVGGIVLAAGCGSAPKSSEKPATPAPSAANTSTPKAGGQDLIFASDRTGAYKLYAKRLGSKVAAVPITTGPSNDNNPQVSPDGRLVAYYSDRDDNDPSDGENQVFIIDRTKPADKPRQVTHNPSDTYDPTWLSDDTLAVKTDDHIHTVHPDGSGDKDVTPTLPDGVEAYKPARIDETHLSFTARFTHGPDKRTNANSDELYTLNITTGEATRNTHNNISDWFSAVNALGEMAFVSRTSPDANDSIYTAPPNASHRKPFPGLDQLSDGDCSDASWLPNNKDIAFTYDGSGSYTTIYKASQSGHREVLDQGPAGSNSLGPIVVASVS